MRMKPVKSALLAAVMASSLLGSAAVLADGGRHYQDRQDYGHYRDHGHRGHGWDRHRKGHHGYRGNAYHYAPRRGRGVTNYYAYDNNDDDDDKLLIGLAIGGLIGYAINQAGGGY